MTQTLGNASGDVLIKRTVLHGLEWYQVYVRGVLAAEAPSEQGARQCARNYVRKLGRLWGESRC